MGGLSKRATFFKQATTTQETLKVDAGTLFFDDELKKNPHRLPQAIVTAEAIVEAYDRMEYDAVAVARQDLHAGLSTIKKLASRASFPLLTANLVDQEDRLIFPPYTQVQRAGMRIAIIGLTGPLPASNSCLEEAHILSWQEVLPDLIAQLSPMSDLIILLSNLESTENRQIAKEHQDIHIILQSGVNKSNMRPMLINNTLISQVGHDGKYVGQLTVTWNNGKKWQQGENSLLTLRKEYDRLDWLISRVRKKGGPQKVYRDNTEKIAAFNTKLLRHQELAAQIKNSNAADQDKEQEQASYSNQFHPLQPSLPDDPKIANLLRAYRQKANRLRRQGVAARRLEGFAGSTSCKSCHKAIYQAWSQTAHAAAYQTLKNKDQNNNLGCVYCHVTGLNQESAHLVDSLPDDLRSVGCESCHGPAKNHAVMPKRSPSPRVPSASLCVGCHSPERDDNFDFSADKAKVH